MITAAAPPSFEKRAIALSVALHCCVAAVLMLVPLGGVTLGTGEGAVASSPVFILHFERRLRSVERSVERSAAPALAAVSRLPAPSPHASAAPARGSLRPNLASAAQSVRSGPLEAPAPGLVAAPAPSAEPQPSLAPASDAPAAVPVEAAAEPPPQTAALGPANWGSRWDSPTLRDRALLDEIAIRLGRRGVVTIAVDDEGRATEVRIQAPGLDAASIEDLRKRLLAARYLPVERDGIAFEGTLQIRGAR